MRWSGRGHFGTELMRQAAKYYANTLLPSPLVKRLFDVVRKMELAGGYGRRIAWAVGGP